MKKIHVIRRLSRRVLILVIGILLLLSGSVGAAQTLSRSRALDPAASAPNWNPPFPRIGQVTFYNPGLAGPDAWQDHDLVVLRYYYSQGARLVKEQNPDAILLAANDDLEGVDTESAFGRAFPEAWYLHDDQGDKLPFWGGYMVNIGDESPRVDFVYGSQRYNAFLPQYLTEKTDWETFDGSFFDTWYSMLKWYVPDVQKLDLDYDGAADGEELANQRWSRGKQTLVSNLRQLSGKPILAHESDASYLNGNGFEFWTQETVASRAYNMETAMRLLEEAVAPQLNYANSSAPGFGPVFRADFTSAQIAGAYFGHDEGTFAHRWTYLHDEYMGELGFPTTHPEQLESGLWIRYFDKGVIISNISGSPKTIVADDLSEGPYYRFRGNQDPSFNDGSQFVQVNLEALDGIMLFKEPTTLITPIVIDNEAHNMTTIGQEPIQYSAGWEPVNPSKRGYYLKYGWGEAANAYAMHTDLGTASYRPSIYVSGQYEVYEWHPDTEEDGQGVGCGDVQLEISHSDGTARIGVNQRVDAGQWNSLGIYPFHQETDPAVRLYAPGGCTAASDAIKFVWRGDQASSTFADVPPDHPFHDPIEILYQADYISGCSVDPLLYCPEEILTRAESAVFVERGIHGAGTMPPAPREQIFADVPLDPWYAKWVNALWRDGYTAGCGTDPLIYCPEQENTRAQGCVFFLRMMHGADYSPPAAVGTFSDVPLDSWYAGWVEAAYQAGLIPACQAEPDLKFCPHDPLDRGLAAYMMVHAKGLEP